MKAGGRERRKSARAQGARVRRKAGGTRFAPPARFGTFSLRRRWTNTTGESVNTLRFRLVEMTTGATPAVEGAALEAPPSASHGGGFNSALAAGTVSLSEPPAPGASLNLQFLLGVQQPGAYRCFVNVEALPDAPAPPSSRSKAGAPQPKAAKGIKRGGESAAVFVLMFWPALFAGRFLLLADSYSYSLPLRAEVWRMLRDGAPPLWTPHILGGYPLLSMAQLGVGYPLTWGYALLPPRWAEQVHVLAPYLSRKQKAEGGRQSSTDRLPPSALLTANC